MFEVTLLWNAGPSSFQDAAARAPVCCSRDRRARQRIPDKRPHRPSPAGTHHQPSLDTHEPYQPGSVPCTCAARLPALDMASLEPAIRKVLHRIENLVLRHNPRPIILGHPPPTFLLPRVSTHGRMGEGGEGSGGTPSDLLAAAMAKQHAVADPIKQLFRTRKRLFHERMLCQRSTTGRSTSPIRCDTPEPSPINVRRPASVIRPPRRDLERLTCLAISCSACWLTGFRPIPGRSGWR